MKMYGKNYTNHLKFVPIIFETKNYDRISKILNQRKKNNYLMFPSYLLRDKKNGLIHSFRIYNLSIKTNENAFIIELFYLKEC